MAQIQVQACSSVFVRRYRHKRMLFCAFNLYSLVNTRHTHFVKHLHNIQCISHLHTNSLSLSFSFSLSLSLSHPLLHPPLSLGFPEFVSYPEFRRLYGALLPPDVGNQSMSDKEKAEFILTCAAVEKSTYRLGLSRVFFRARTLAKLDRQVEDTTHDTIVQFQVIYITCFTLSTLATLHHPFVGDCRLF